MKLKPREQLLLLGLGVVLLVFVGRYLLGGEAPAPPVEAATGGSRAEVAAAIDGVEGPARTRTRRTSRTRGATESRPGEVLALRLEALEGSPSEFSPGRNPWRYAPRRVVRQPPPPRVDPKPPPPRQPRVESPPEQPREPPKPTPPPIDLRYLGSFGPQAAPIAVFSDPEDVLYNAPPGSVVKEEFIVREVGLESVSVGWVRFPEAEPERLAVGGR